MRSWDCVGRGWVSGSDIDAGEGLEWRGDCTMPSLSATKPSRRMFRRSMARFPFTSPLGPCRISVSISSFKFIFSGSASFFTIAPRLGTAAVLGIPFAERSLFALDRALNRF